MSNWKEFTAKTVSDALTEASVYFQVPSSKVEYEVLEESKGGILGLFSRPAKIRAKIKQETEEENLKIDSVPDRTNKVDIKEQPITYQKVSVTVKEEAQLNTGDEEIEKRIVYNVDEIETMAKSFLTEVLQAMSLQAEVKAVYDQNESVVNIDIQGGDMGILIGKRGQTLDSLQYLTSLVINKKTSSYLKVKLDTENYRERRKKTLENLAKNIAFKVKKSKHSVALEPMNPYERRIIHSTLQSDKFVETHSEGEEPYRKVVVTLKKGFKEYNSTTNNRNNKGTYNNRKDFKKNYTAKATEVKKDES